MAEQFITTEHEGVKLTEHPEGIIAETIDRHFGYRALTLFDLEEL